MTKALIVFHSRSGTTRRVAQALARRLNADIDEIRIVQSMAGTLGYVFCAIEAITWLTPALRPMRKDLSAYDLVVIGTPVWFWSLSSPVRSWLTEHRIAHGRVAFFCTMGGSGARRVFATMTELAGRAPSATLALTDRQIERDYSAKLDAFVRRLEAGTHRRAERSARHAPAAHAAA